MYQNLEGWVAGQHQQELLARARRDRQSARARALRRAGRQAVRARRRLERAQSDIFWLREDTGGRT